MKMKKHIFKHSKKPIKQLFDRGEEIMVNFILEETRLVFIYDIEILGSLDTNRLLVKVLKTNEIYTIDRTNILNADYTQYKV